MRKRNWKTWFQIGVTAVAITACGVAATTAIAQNDERPRARQADRRAIDGERGERILARMVEELDLSDEQRSQVKQIMEQTRADYRDWFQANQERIKAVRAEFQAAREAGDREKMRELAPQVRELMASAPKPQAAIEKVRAVLNADQLEDFDRMVAEGRERMMERWNQGQPFGARGQDLRQLLGKLDLTDDQKTQVREILEGARDEFEQWRAAHQEELAGLRQRMADAREARDPEQMRALGEELRGLMQDAPKPRDVLDDIRGVLTDEQRQQFDAFVKEREGDWRQRWQDRRGERGERGDRRPRARRGADKQE